MRQSRPQYVVAALQAPAALSHYSMRNIAVLCNDEQLNAEIAAACQEFDDEFSPVFLAAVDSFVQYLNYELPEIDIVYFGAAGVDVSTALDAVKNDPWLHFGGSIVIYDEASEHDLLERFRGVNIIALIHRDRVSLYLPRALSVLYLNRSILFQRDLHALLQANLEGAFVMNNDPFDAATYSNLLSNFLYNSNLLSLEGKYDFNTALTELLYNAIEHGNCGITFEEKREFLAGNSDIVRLIREKNQAPEVGRRKVRLNYRISPERSSFAIQDEGAGFDWRSRYGREENTEELHGRGIMIARHYLKELRYNEKGNEVYFEIGHLENESNAVPRVFSQTAVEEYQDGEIVFRQGDSSSHIYYIVAGRFDIFANDRKVSTLTPADIFLGEMSFLLNNRRSATVVAAGGGSLIKLSKEAFINAIKREPHYGIFLARLLAQRLQQLHDFPV
ncbi:MAG: cyclic nucleotide-binding domain-containing protein [Leptospirales bacterium]|nr:cyclic nucleotide-binding domain-containing protein [Leptospirales bacterium]